MFRSTLIAGIATLAFAATGCELYFGPDDDDDFYSYCDESGCYTCDDYGCVPSGGPGGPGGEGWNCEVNADCAAGCYCGSNKTCEEAGFCRVKSDCPSGFECDDRNSCVPGNSNPGTCTDDDQCAWGSYCDEASGTCVDSWTCSVGENCPMGFECDGRGVCVPAPCEDDNQCEAGCYCNTDANECVETGTCTDNSQCEALDMQCDLGRGTCVPKPPGCDSETNPCDDGYTCNEDRECVESECRLLTDENICGGRADCTPVYVAQCRDPQGNVCQEGTMNCECTGLEFGFCESNQ